ncbi:MAG: RNase adapter protein RapZ [Actinomycetota bacterium]|nr:RNase adapter protein RapZ [Actinomycetota bacterium]
MSTERPLEVTVITGLSGAGRSESSKALEDLGWYVIDNLPPQLIETMISLTTSAGSLISRLALVLDARGGAFFEEAEAALDALRKQVDYRLVFLEADDDVLIRRFDATRRRHPFVAEDNVELSIRKERELMQPFRDRADLIIDTTDLSARDLRSRINSTFGGTDPSTGLKTTVVSFGYKYGLPVDADIVLDVRFLPNPHWVPELRPLSGLDEEIRDFVLGQKGTTEFLTKTKELLAVLMPGYEEEGRHYLTIAIGCTGGRHRSVVLSQEICEFVSSSGYNAQLIHRDVERSVVSR